MYLRRIRALTLAFAVLGSACASAGAPTLANKFVRQGTPSVDLGGPRPSSQRSNETAARLRAARPAAPASRSAGSLEGSDPDIRQALAHLGAAPTASQYLDVARAYINRGVLDRAHDYLHRSLDANGADAFVYDALARIWREWGLPAAGLGDAHRAVYLAPRSPIVHNTLGTVLYRLGQRKEAAASFSRAFAIDPAAWYALANLCHVNMAAGRTREAIAQCQQAIALKVSK